MEQVTKPVEGQYNGQETTATHGGLEVPGCAGELEGSKTICKLSSEHEIYSNLNRTWNGKSG